MKITVLIILALPFIACQSSKEVQADFVNAKLEKIDTVYRYQQSEKILKWRVGNNVRFVSFVGLNEQYAIGTIYKVLLTK